MGSDQLSDAIQHMEERQFDKQNDIFVYFEHGKWPTDEQFETVIKLSEDLKIINAKIDALEEI